MIELEKFKNTALELLKANYTGSFTKPSKNLYPYQWNWDSAVIALGLSEYDVQASQTEIRSLIKGQWKDGMIPHIVFHEPVVPGYFPDPNFWETWKNPNSPQLSTSGMTQPPVLASVIKQMHARKPMLSFVREVFPALLRWHRWLHVDRVIDGTGITCLIHPWESGTDDSPRWLSVMDTFQSENLPPYKRVDNQIIDPEERPNKEDYDRYIYLVDICRRNKYNTQEILAKSPFVVQDVLFTSILFKADKDLMFLAKELGEETAEIEAWVKQVQSFFASRFWHADRGLFFDFDMRNNKSICVNTIATFAPLYAGLCTTEQAERLVNDHLMNPDEYFPGKTLQFGISSVSKSESCWEPRRYWRGPIWIITNWLVRQGLINYGFLDIAEQVRKDSCELIEKSGFREYYDPTNGQGCGSKEFSWSASLILEMVGHD